MTFTTLYSRYQTDMARVESMMQSVVQSRNDSLTAAATQLIDAGGKRIRPLFALICSRVGGTDAGEEVIALASAIELIHSATLVHDDVIDDSALRRGQPTVRAGFGNRPAMYCGDFLFAQAIALLSTIDNLPVHRLMSDAIVRMVEGEIDQLQDFFNWDQNLRQYLRRIERKTALLISVSCELGALVGGTNPANAKRLGRFGYYTGMAFQILDDVLDYVGDAATVGKPVGGDLRQGNLTLPALRALAGGGAGTSLLTLVQDGMTDGHLHEALAIVRDSDGVTVTRALADRYMRKALATLEWIDSPDVRRELAEVSMLLNQRMY